MANLLPPQELKRVRRHFRDRMIGTGSLVAIVCGLGALLALLPVYLSVRITGSPPESVIAADTFSEERDREEIARARLLIRDLETATATSTSALVIFGEIFDARPSGTIITNASLARGKDGTITLAGTSASRDDINAYRNALDENARFESVAVPIGVLAGTAGKTFTMTIKGKF